MRIFGCIGATFFVFFTLYRHNFGVLRGEIIEGGSIDCIILYKHER